MGLSRVRAAIGAVCQLANLVEAMACRPSSGIGLRAAYRVLPPRDCRLLPRWHACRLQAQLAMEEDKRRQWAEENSRRRTDYIPLAFQLLTALAQKGQLQPLVDKAVEAHRLKREQQAQKAGS